MTFLKVKAVLCALVISSLLICTSVTATTITIVNLDGPGEGLNDVSPVAPVSGNPATTLGAQYLNVFQAAADYWEARLDSPVEIRIDTQMNPLFCTSSSATLGSAGPINSFINFSGAPLPWTIYTVAQANSLAGRDIDPEHNDIGATFNSNLNGDLGCLGGNKWWLGIGAAAPDRTISLFDTALHEIAHGVGFITFVDSSGSRLMNWNDTYMLNLFDQTSQKSWANMSNFERARSSVNNGNLVWNGVNARTQSSHIIDGKNNGRLRLFAPNRYRFGSSVSHWDTALAPDELMEPFATSVTNDCSTMLALKDMGWNTKGGVGELHFAASAYAGNEEQGSVRVQVTRPLGCGGAPTGAVQVTVSSENGTALAGSDYTAVRQVLSWSDGESGSKTVTISLLDDGLDEPEKETFNLMLSDVTGGATLTGPTTISVTISDEAEEFCVPIKAKNGNIAIVCL